MASAHSGSGGTAEGGAASGEGGTPAEGGGGEGGSEAGSPAGGAGAAGAAGAAGTPEPCPDSESCVPRTQGWIGPVAFWEGNATTPSNPPPCPEGYEKPVDLHRGVNNPPGGCKCTCKPMGQACGANTKLQIFDDYACKQECSHSSPLVCDPVSGCTGSQGSLTAPKSAPTGGTCEPSYSEFPEATWQKDARLCSPSNVCHDPAQACAPTPGAPYPSQLCVTRRVLENRPIPDCPSDYPDQTLLYETKTDGRGCTTCTCGAVTGGLCSGTLTINWGSECGTGYDYTLGTGCQMFNLGQGPIHPTLIGTRYSLTPGTCTVTTQSQPDEGVAKESGPVTVVCCQ